MCVFDNNWFRQHQRRLLWLCNSPVTRDWFRHLLRIDRDHPVEQPIVQIMPQSIILANGGNEFTLDTRCAPKFANRLYHGLLPLWWGMHGWDNLIANRYRPAWNLGFDTLTVYPDAGVGATTVDGYAVWGTTLSWANMRNASAGSIAAYDNSATKMRVGLTTSATPNYYTMARSVMLFDTSSLTSSASLSAATISLYGTGDKTDGGTVDPGFNISSSNPYWDNYVGKGEIYDHFSYDRCGHTAFSSSIAYNSISSAAYNDWALNASGISNISLTAISKFSAQLQADIDGSDPNWHTGAAEDAYFWTADKTGTSNDPKLVATYTLLAAWIPQVMII